MPPVPHACDEVVDVALDGAPDLGAGRHAMDGGVGGIDELAGMNELGISAASSSARAMALHAQRTLGEHQLGAVSAHEVATFDHGSGIAMMRRMPHAAAIAASPIPVFP